MEDKAKQAWSVEEEYTSGKAGQLDTLVTHSNLVTGLDVRLADEQIRDEQRAERRGLRSNKVAPANMNMKTGSTIAEHDSDNPEQSLSLTRLAMRNGETQHRVRQSFVKLLQLLSCYAILLVGGGAIYYAIEQPVVDRRRQEARMEMAAIEAILGHNKTVLEFLKSTKLLRQAMSTRHYDRPLDLGSCIFYVFSVATTIGYGEFSPRGGWGQVFTVIYSVISIPIAGMILVSGAEAAIRFFTYMYSLTINRAEAAFRALDAKELGYLSREEMSNGLNSLGLPELSSEECSELLERIDANHDDRIDIEEFTQAVHVLHADLSILSIEKVQVKLVSLLIIIWMALGSVYFSIAEDWEFREAFYFAFVSLMTIGLGDRLPKNHSSYVVLYIFALVGLGLLAVFVNLLSIIFLAAGKTVKKKTIIAEKVLIQKTKTAGQLVRKKTAQIQNRLFHTS